MLAYTFRSAFLYVMLTSVILCRVNKAVAENLQLRDPKNEFTVCSEPFNLNGLTLQYQYIVKRYDSTDRNKVEVVCKKVIDLKRKIVLIIENASEASGGDIVLLENISERRYLQKDFQDVNFDGYYDIRIPCQVCSGSRNSFERIYLYSPVGKKFINYPKIDVNVKIDRQRKTLSSINVDGAWSYTKSVKFGTNGGELYNTSLLCEPINKNGIWLARYVYKKFKGNKLVNCKTHLSRKFIYN